MMGLRRRRVSAERALERLWDSACCSGSSATCRVVCCRVSSSPGAHDSAICSNPPFLSLSVALLAVALPRDVGEGAVSLLGTWIIQKKGTMATVAVGGCR
jgi:hypothetical protein